MRKKVLVTGATGFIGSNLIRRLVADGYMTHIFCRKSSNLWRIQDITKKITIHYVDINSRRSIERAYEQIKPNYVFHLASIGLYGGIESDYKNIIQTNIVGTTNLLSVAANFGYECFVNTGSSSEYGAKSKKMSENDICEPESVYAISKLGSSLLSTYSYFAASKNITTLRLFSPFGPYDNKSRLISYGIQNALRNKPLMLANKKSVRDYVYVDDVVDAYISCVKHISKAKGRVINIGTGKEFEVEDVVDTIIKLTSSQSKKIWRTESPRPFESSVWKADVTNAYKILKWKPEYSLEAGLKKTIDWFRTNSSQSYYKELVIEHA